jgi:hypothetical protein
MRSIPLSRLLDPDDGTALVLPRNLADRRTFYFAGAAHHFMEEVGTRRLVPISGPSPKDYAFEAYQAAADIDWVGEHGGC